MTQMSKVIRNETWRQVPELGWSNGLTNLWIGFTLVTHIAQRSSYSHNPTSTQLYQSFGVRCDLSSSMSSETLLKSFWVVCDGLLMVSMVCWRQHLGSRLSSWSKEWELYQQVSSIWSSSVSPGIIDGVALLTPFLVRWFLWPVLLLDLWACEDYKCCQWKN